MRDYLNEHRAIFMKHARTYVRVHGDMIPAEDIAREMELELTQLAKDKRLDPSKLSSPDLIVRTLVKHAAGRAKRRRKLVEQVAAGDDLQAVSDDLAALDGDLPDVTIVDSPAASEARAELDKVKTRLDPRDGLIFAVLIEDHNTVDEVARILAAPASEIEDARVRILAAAEEAGIPELGLAQRPSITDAAERA